VSSSIPHFGDQPSSATPERGDGRAPSASRPTFASAHPWIRQLTRMGFVARGVLYSCIGLLTCWSILRNGQHAHGGMTSTFDSIHSLRPGIILLGGLAIGFAGFAVGMTWTAIFDWNNDGRTTLGLMRRAGTLIGGLGHLGLMASALLLVAGHQPQGHGTRRFAEAVIRYPGGREAVAIAGLWAIGYGLFLLSKVWTGRLDGLLDISSMPPRGARFSNWVGRFGMFSRGVIYVTIGVVLTVAGFRGDANNVVGFGGAMRTLSDNAYGIACLSITAAGLFCYGLFMFVEARYRRIGQCAPAERLESFFQ
jgi:hypothetical protein